jgi:peptide deformylase
MINPVIVEASDESTVAPEASVSMPGFTIPVRRATRVTVTYRDEAFVSHTRTLDGWDARCLQHELDHLEGRLLIDHPGTTRQQRRHAERMAAADLERNTRRSR